MINSWLDKSVAKHHASKRMENMTEEQKAYEEGKQAYHAYPDGKSLMDNPYKGRLTATRELAWDEGYLDAEWQT